MTHRSVTHATFCIERQFPASPARVFEAFANPAAKAKWFGGPDEWVEDGREMDFRVGGRERLAGGPKGQPSHIFTNLYLDIVPNERIIYAYEMRLGETKISASLATIEFKAAGAGTRLVFTEQGAFLDGWDNPAQREEGTKGLLDKLEASLRSAGA